MVKYQIQFKPIHPGTNKPITNSNTYSGGSLTSLALDYDCILAYTRVSTTGNMSPSADIKQIPQEIWAVYGSYTSVKEAMKIAKPLISKYGIDNVQICKIAPSSIQIVFEED